MTKRVALISCVKTKAATARPAADLYISHWFLKARALVERHDLMWFILSTEHGLVAPGAEIAPYERTLNRMTRREREEWGAKVVKQMAEGIPEADEILIFAGERYRKPLLPYLVKRFQTVTIPMCGLTSGRQLQWLKNVDTI